MKLKLVVDLCFDNKVWDTLFYLLGESDARASSLDFSGPMAHVVGDVFIEYWWSFSYVHVMIGVIILELEPFWWLLVVGSYFLVERWRLYLHASIRGSWHVCSWIWIAGWHVDLCLSAHILMWSYKLVMHCKLGTCPKYLFYVATDLWLAQLGMCSWHIGGAFPMCA